MSAPSAIDQLGPVDRIVVELPGSAFTGEIAPALGDLVDRELIRVLDLLVWKKGEDGGGGGPRRHPTRGPSPGTSAAPTGG